MQIIRVIQVRYMDLRVNYKMYNYKLVIVFNIAIIPAMSVTTLLEIMVILLFLLLHYPTGVHTKKVRPVKYKVTIFTSYYLN